MTVQTAREKPQPLSADGRLVASHLFLIFAITILCCWPLLRYGIPELSQDGIIHAGWQNNFSKQLWGGDLYPRWLSDVNDRLGSPTFFFYPAIPSYAASIFRPSLASRDPDGWLQAGYGCVLAMLLSGFAACFWLRLYASAPAALLGAIVYMLAPYHLAVDLYVRGAVSELWAFVWLPVILLAAEGLARKSKWAFAGLAIGYALLVMTHLPTAVCFSPVLLAFAWLFVEPARKIAGLLKTVGAMALGAGLSAIYLVPAMLDQSKARMHSVGDFYAYRRNLLLLNFSWPPNFQMRLLLLNLSTMVLMAMFLWLCFTHQPQFGRERQLALFYCGVSLFALFFMTRLSDPFWRFVPFLKDVEFPWRFSTLIALAAAALSALGFSYLQDRQTRWIVVCLGIIVAGWIGAAALTAWRAYPEFQSAPQPQPGNRQLIKFLADPCEFWPATSVLNDTCIESVPARLPILAKLLANNPPKSVLLQGTTAHAGGSVTVADWRPRTILLDVDAPEPQQLTLIHFYYPGWYGHIDATPERIPAFASKPEGFIQMQVPQGKYRLVVELGRELPERLGIAISLASVATTLALLAFGYFSNSHQLRDV